MKPTRYGVLLYKAEDGLWCSQAVKVVGNKIEVLQQYPATLRVSAMSQALAVIDDALEDSTE